MAEAFLAFEPIHHLTTQPFAGHDRSIENEAEHSGKFFDLCRKHNPDVTHWLYCQWPNVQIKTDIWAKGGGSAKSLKLAPATTWQQGVTNHLAYTEAVRQRMDDAHEGRPVRIVPGGVALAKLKDAIEPRGQGERAQLRSDRGAGPPLPALGMGQREGLPLGESDGIDIARGRGKRRRAI